MMLSKKDTSWIYSRSEHLANKKLLHRMFATCDPDKYTWNSHPIEITRSDNMTFLKFSFLDIHTFDDALDFAFLNLIDQTIALYEEYEDHYDADSDELLNLFESFLKDLDVKYQIKLNNTLYKTAYNFSVSSTGNLNPTYAWI